MDRAINSSKWVWMMDYCKRAGISPANSDHWGKAEVAFTNEVENKVKDKQGSLINR